MIFSQTSEYALRAMACLANSGGDVRTSEDLARRAQMPSHYVSKVMRQLVVAELVEARRGHGGGFRLARPPEEIRLVDVLQATGEAPHMLGCVFGLPTCGWSNPCPLHPSWVRLKDSIAEWAETTTLASAVAEVHSPPEAT